MKGSLLFPVRIRAAVIALPCVFILFACGASQLVDLSRQPSKAMLLEQGRFHRFFSRSEQAGLNLNQALLGAVGKEVLTDSEQLAALSFDAETAPKFSRQELAGQGQALLSRYAGQFADFRLDEWERAERYWQEDPRSLYLNYKRVSQGILVRDNYLQIVFHTSAPDEFTLREIRGQLTGSRTNQFEFPEVSDAIFYQWHEGEQIPVAMTRHWEWLPFWNKQDFEWKLGRVYQWLENEHSWQATYLPADEVWVEAFSQTLHAKSLEVEVFDRNYRDFSGLAFPLSFSQLQSKQDQEVLVGAEAIFPKDFQLDSFRLQGPRVTVTDYSSTGTSRYPYVATDEENPIFRPASDRLAAVNAFVAVQRINRYVRQFMSDKQLGFLQNPLKVSVNLSDQVCNAFYSPKQKSLLLYKEAKGCSNMALVNDVIYHEWGHALDDEAGRTPGIQDPAFSEGLADVVAAYFTEDPEIAPFFLWNDDSPIRDVRSDRRYPRDKGQMHYEGGIIARAFWDLRQALIERYGYSRGKYQASWLFFHHLVSIDSYTESYASVLRLDDEDGNPTTRSPNFCLINRVFAERGLAVKEDCEDFAADSLPRLEGVELLLLDSGKEWGQAFVVFSHEDAARLEFCMGTKRDCWMNPSLPRKALERIEGEKDRRFFRSLEPLTFAKLNAITVFGWDQQDQSLGAREFIIFEK